MKKILLPLTIALLFVVNMKAQQKQEIIKGTWITNVASDVLKSKRNIAEGIKLCKKNGINNVYVVVWNNGVTMYPSKVVEEYIGVKQSPVYGNRDPLKEMIEEGHKAGIKVHAWFEFGFSYAYNDSNSVWLKKYPAWAGRNNQGNLLQKNKFYWWSGINPEVQTFMKKLIGEVVRNYEVDGIQGDDRLPAMPGEGGYDAYTMQLYAKQHNGSVPPRNPKDTLWLQWKADQLSAFAKSVYQMVKSIKQDCIVSWAPSIYPWCKEQYLQDWPKWLSDGYADYIIPQLYRYKIDDYEKVLKELDALLSSSAKQKVLPGMLTSLGDGYQATRELTGKMIQLNRKYGFKGEVFFYFETLHRMKGKLYTN
ncbi:MAG: family 10 glycosylhydrolase [Ferruginibacter sp.]|nr:family 10 glycosylhydrolase [Ferruginibacter sp.]